MARKRDLRRRFTQAFERYYHCVLLVCIFYSPHVHDLGFLRIQAERIDMRLFDVWPREARRERAMFQKLKEAYVKAHKSGFRASKIGANQDAVART